jgi:hypothetical protein
MTYKKDIFRWVARLWIRKNCVSLPFGRFSRIGPSLMLRERNTFYWSSMSLVGKVSIQVSLLLANRLPLTFTVGPMRSGRGHRSRHTLKTLNDLYQFMRLGRENKVNSGTSHSCIQTLSHHFPKLLRLKAGQITTYHWHQRI